MAPSSRLSGFHRLSLAERVQRVAEFADLSAEERALLGSAASLPLAQADGMIENVVGIYGLPLGIATNFFIQGRDRLVPLAIEEPSVVAGLSYAARLIREGGGFTSEADPPEMVGQMQVLDVADPAAARLRLLAARDALLAQADAVHPGLVRRGGGARAIEVRLLEGPLGPLLVVHLVCDVRDAMGANIVNTAVEALAPQVEAISGGRVLVRVVSNLADRRLARARAVVPQSALALEGLTGAEGVQHILEAHAFAVADPYRAATHNKGIMNGIDAVALATGNDWRALEAGAHAYAARTGRYLPLTTWERTASGDLAGAIELPLAVGIVGGVTRAHPLARVALKILGVATAQECAQVLACVGLAQNLAALRALAMEGIQRGHMRLHARGVALSAGATVEEASAVAAQMAAEGAIRPDRAQAILAVLRTKDLAV